MSVLGAMLFGFVGTSVWAAGPAPMLADPASLVGLAEVPADDEEDDAEYGPFFEAPAPSDAQFVTRRERQTPLLSVANGGFCFIESAQCKASLLVTGEVASGLFITPQARGVDLPYAHWGFNGGLTIRPVMLARGRWSPWTMGFVGGWARGVGAAAFTASQAIRETRHTDTWRVALLNQIWLGQGRNAFHVDIALGAAHSAVRALPARAYGTHLELAAGVGGWGALFAGVNLLDEDTRLVFGFRGHGLAAGPVFALIALGLLAGGAL